MNVESFRAWLISQGYDIGTINARISNCQRVDNHEGDLDRLYEEDRCVTLIDRLTYSTSDVRANLPPRHSIPMTGNIRNGTATLKQSVKLYVRFKDDTLSACMDQPVAQPIALAEQAAPVVAEHSTISNQSLDSYAQFLEYFNIDKDDFYSFGLENTIFASVEHAQAQWNILKNSLLTNNRMSIRSYGRHGRNSELFQKLYVYLFANNNIHIDQTNNTAPRNNLQRTTGHRLRVTLLNYQCSHIFGHTKNPLLFEAVWNMCFTPKIFDPLTGHEAKGPWPLEYQVKLRYLVRSRFSSLISDYNTFVEEHNIKERIEEFVTSIAAEYDAELLADFKRDAIFEWKKITLSEEETE